MIRTEVVENCSGCSNTMPSSRPTSSAFVVAGFWLGRLIVAGPRAL